MSQTGCISHISAPARETSTMGADFKDKRVLVTGGGSGLGRATCLHLAKLGATVFALSHIQADLDSLKAENPDIETICLDLTEYSKSREVVQKITPISYLVNCAGVLTVSNVIDATMEDFDITFGVNVKAMLNVSQVVAKDLIQRKEKGSIVNISSIGADRVFPQVATYTATKNAVNAYTKVMAVEWAVHGIRVNAISPSYMKTPMARDNEERIGVSIIPAVIARTPGQKTAELDDVVNAIVFLLSEKSDMITGHILPVDGGYLCT